LTAKLIDKNSGTDKNLIFTSQEIVLMMILLSKLIENKSNEISIKEIEKYYRKKRTGRIINTTIQNTYLVTLMKLQEKSLLFHVGDVRKRYKVSNISAEQQLLELTDCKKDKVNNLTFNYSFGKFEEVIIKSKRYSDLLPIEVMHSSYKQITFVLISLYIGRLIFINQRKRKKTICITIKGIMSHIYTFDKEGYNTGKTYYDVINSSVSNKYTLLKLFQKNLLKILDLLKAKGSIKEYQLKPNNIKTINISNYDLIKLEITI
jgi:hypothetical protein